MFHRIIAGFIAGVLWWSVQVGAQGIPVDGYAAIVHDKIITIGEVMAYMRPVDAQLRQAYEGEELQQKLMEAFVKSRETLIEEKLVIQDFEARGLVIPEQLIDERINSIIHDRFDDDRAAFLEALASQRMTREEMRNQVREGLILMISRRQEVSDRVDISPMALQEAYEADLERYREPGKIKLRMIVINPVKTPAELEVKQREMDEILQQLADGRDFGELAKEVSEDNKAQYGGDWGWIEAGSLRAELAAVAMELTPGKVSDVVELEGANYLLLVEERKDPSVTPLDEVRSQIEREISMKEEERLYNQWINRLREKYYIQIVN